MTTEPNVITALAAVMSELPGIGKADKSPEGYSYRGIEAITKHLQPLLAKHCVIITPSATIIATRPVVGMKEGWQDIEITVDWRIYGPGGPLDVIEARTTGIGRDKSDKGANKAQTQAYKYLLLHLLSIADKADDADGITYEHDRIDPTTMRPGDEMAARVKQAIEAHPSIVRALKEADTERRGFGGEALDDKAWREQVAAILDTPIEVAA